MEQEIPQEDLQAVDPELDGPAATEEPASEPESAPPAEDGVQPYEPTPEEPAPGGVPPADPESAAEDSAAQEPVAAPVESAKPKERELSRFHTKPWPGPFAALRAGFGAGTALVPRMGVDLTLQARDPLAQMAPYLGLELGAGKHRWGASFSVDGTILGPQPEYLAGAPAHFATSINVFHMPRESRYRWVLGLRPYMQYSMTWSTGQTMTLRGYGLQIAGHRLLKRWEKSVLEGFLMISFDRYTEAVAGFDGNTKSYDVADFVGVRKFVSLVLIQAGIQFGSLW